MIYMLFSDTHAIHKCDNEYTAIRVLHALTSEEDATNASIVEEQTYYAGKDLPIRTSETRALQIDMGGPILMGSEVVFRISDDLSIQTYGHQYLGVLTQLNNALRDEAREQRGYVALNCSWYVACLSTATATALREAMVARSADMKAQESRFVEAQGLTGWVRPAQTDEEKKNVM